jgi:hypothetical protein
LVTMAVSYALFTAALVVARRNREREGAAY